MDSATVNAIHEDIEAKEAAKNMEAQGTSDNNRYCLHVVNFSYKPRRHLVKQGLQSFREQMTKFNIGWLFPSLREVKAGMHRDLVLHRINFAARGGEITAIVGHHDEARELLHMVCGRTKTGNFDGDILLSGPGIDNTSYYHDNVAFVPAKPLYIPGLTYLEMLRFSVQLKVMPQKGVNTSQVVEERVHELLSLMNLVKCKNRVIPQYPPLRGEEGSDLRRLGICLEIARLPPVIVINEPTLSLGPAFALGITQCLRTLADRGHVVLVAMNKVYPTEVGLLDRIILLSEGYSIFSNSPDNAVKFFTSPTMGYDYKPEVDIIDYLLDISTAVERPVTQREADIPMIMQEKYESSDYFEHISVTDNVTISAFSSDFFKLLGYGRFDPPLYALYRIITVIKRAIYTKFKDYDTLRQGVTATLVISLLCGYLQLGQGNYGHYCLALIHFPYTETANTSALMFFITAFCWAFPYLTVHTICQKLQLYRYELASGCCTTFAFILGAILSEVPFQLAFTWVFATITYFMADMSKGYENYVFWVTALLMQSMVGLSGAYLYAALFRKELVVRDLFLTTITFVALLSGFPFQLTVMTDYLASASVVNPLRWTFEGLMNWKFNQYEDGPSWLDPYSFKDFTHHFLLNILGNFVIISNCITLVFILKEPIFLKRLTATGKVYGNTSISRDSTGSMDGSLGGASGLGRGNEEFGRKSTRQSELVKPVVFMRESSVTGRASKLSINVSQMGEENMDRGPTVMFKDLSLRIPDKSPRGYKTVLQRVSGRFDWGKLNMIMGAAKSGKTSLVQVLAGDIGMGSEVTGKILFDGKYPDPKQPLYQRCGFVPADNEHLRDLSVKEVLSFAMKLRCLNRLGLKYVEENVNRTIENLHLEECVNRKTKKLTPGELKRLSIAEEMVHGPKLLIMDEPTTGVNIYEVVVLLTTFREMVNQDRTVIATIHQPTAEEFKLFDNLLLLSKGRVIYHGPVANATQFFVSSPFAFDYNNYTNPGDFLTDISGSFITNSKNEYVDASILENYYMQTDSFNRLITQITAKIPKASDSEASSSSSQNPMLMKYGGNGSNGSNAGTGSERPSLSDVAAGNSFELENPDASESSKTVPQTTFISKTVSQGFTHLYNEMFTLPTVDNISEMFFKGGILFHRSVLALVRRHELLVSSTLLHVVLAVLFGWIMGDSSGSSGVYNTNSFFAVGSMFLVIANVAFIFYMFNNHQVFLKEYARGLYTNFLKWAVTDYPLYILRMTNGIIFTMIVYGMTNQDTSPDKFGFACLAFMFFILASVNLSEIIIFGSPDKRVAYTSIPGLAFLNFLFSGLFIKAQSLPSWLGPWAPSISMIRWNMQANFINTYEGNTDAFKTLPSGYSTYTTFLNLFGWGGKTKWYCFYMVLANIAVFKFLSLWASAYTAINRKGGKRNVDQE